MRKLSSLITGAAAVTLIAGRLGCPSVDAGDPFDSVRTKTTTANEEETGDGDGDPTGDGDGDPTGDGDGDGDPTGDGDGDACGNIGDTCTADSCCAGLSCGGDGTCSLGGGDGDGDPGDGDGDLGTCDANDGYCLSNGCQATQGQGLVLDTDMNGMPDLGWCLYACTMDNECPAATSGDAMISCQQWNMDGDMACFQLCAPNVTECPAGSTCFPLGGGAGVCAYDAAGFG